LIANSIELEQKNQEIAFLKQELLESEKTKLELIEEVDQLKKMMIEIVRKNPKPLKSKKVDRITFDKERSYDHQDLLDTAVIVLAGEQFEKFEALMKITNRSCVSKTIFYRYSPIVLRIVQEIFEGEQVRLVQLIRELYAQEKLGTLLLAIDGAWNKRGHNSMLGNFAAILISHHDSINNKVLYQHTRTFSRNHLKNNQVINVHKGLISYLV